MRLGIEDCERAVSYYTPATSTGSKTSQIVMSNTALAPPTEC